MPTSFAVDKGYNKPILACLPNCQFVRGIHRKFVTPTDSHIMNIIDYQWLLESRYKQVVVIFIYEMNNNYIFF